MPVSPMPLTHPDFPHGTVTGYSKGCRADTDCPARPSCHAVSSRSRKTRRLRNEGALPPSPTDRLPSAPVIEHIETIVKAVSTATCNNIDQVAGIRQGTCARLRRGTQPLLSRRIAEKIMAVGEEEVRSRVPVPVTRKMIQVMRSLQAQGWSLEWQAQRYGVNRNILVNIIWGRQKSTSRAIAARIFQTAQELEGKTGPADFAACLARRGGWHPLDHYDSEGNLIDMEAEQREAEREQRALDRLNVLRYSVNGMPTTQIAEKTGVTERVVARYRAEVGLKMDSLFGSWRVAPECLDLAARIRRAALAYESTGEALPLVQELGMMRYGKAQVAA